MIVGGPFGLKLAWVQLGSLVLELLQPVQGDSIWARALETKGEGVHHIAFNVSNWNEIVSKLQQQRGRMVAGDIFEGKHLPLK
jgi:methylmalonyl-CoA/ethylmalonyl-CoA epimerase